MALKLPDDLNTDGAPKEVVSVTYEQYNSSKHYRVEHYNDQTSAKKLEDHSWTSVPGAPSNVKQCKHCNYTYGAEQTPSSSTGNGTVDITISGSATPFNNWSKQIRKSYGGVDIKVGGYAITLPENVAKIYGSKYGKFYDPQGVTSSGVVGSKVTSQNPYYCIGSPISGAVWPGPQGKIQGGGQMLKGYKNNANAFINCPRNSALPNCVGGARGRYQELISKAGWSKSFKSTNASDYAYRTKYVNKKGITPFTSDWKASNKPKTGYQKVAKDFYLRVDKNGDYGPKGGTWGWLSTQEGGRPVPGAMFLWQKKGGGHGHIAFIDAVFDAQSNQCYAITHESASGQSSLNAWYLRMGKRHKIRPKGTAERAAWMDEKENWWCYGGDYRSTYILYTPLCQYTGTASSIPGGNPGDSGSGGNYYDSEGYYDEYGNSTGAWYDTITINYTDPSADQTAAYNQLQDFFDKYTKALVKGAKVKITRSGNQKSSGQGKKVNRIGGEGIVKSILANGIAYPYEVVDNKGIKIGFFTASALLVL